MLTQGFWNFYGSITEAPKTIFQQNVEDLDKFTLSFLNTLPFIYTHPNLLNTLPFSCVLTGFFPKHLKTFTDYAMILFLPSRMLRDFTNYATMLFLTSEMLRIFTDCTTMFVLISRMLRDFTDYTTMGVKHFEVVMRRPHTNK